ncbi:MAG: ATP-binding protein [Planctomycetota bacterium]
MNTPPPQHAFFSDLARMLNAGQSRSVMLTGEVHDLFYLEAADRYVPLVPYLCRRCSVEGVVPLVYELNGPIRCTNAGDRRTLKEAWVRWKTGQSLDQLILQSLNDESARQRRESLEEQFDRLTAEAAGRPTAALEMLRQLTLCSRAQAALGGKRFRLLILVEAADMLLPAADGDITRLSASDRQRVAICQDWFSDPAFMEGDDSVVLLAESRSAIHPRVTRLPQMLTVEVPAPDEARRAFYIERFTRDRPVKIDMGTDGLARLSAGLSLHALRQLLVASAHTGTSITHHAVIDLVEHHITSALGEGVVEFSKPSHTLDDVVGHRRLRAFLNDELIPRIKSTGEDALPGAAIAGPIGSGKTFVFEAVAGGLGLPVLVLKNIRSQYFGQTDVIFEKLRRVLEALGKVILFVDEADTQFGGVGGDAHPTERRLTGKIQALMSDPKLRGRVVWLLMTARIERLSPDIRRPGRVGDLIIPVLDPAPGSDDRRDFLRWVLKGVFDHPDDALLNELDQLTPGYSAAAFAALRSLLKAKAAAQGQLDAATIREVVADVIPADIGDQRERQTLQALLNCTRRSLLPDPDIDESTREAWRRALGQ